jgi:N-acetylglucosamine-6-phosphate deacetylase
MASLYPARALGLDHELGQILPGYRADLAVLDTDIRVVRTRAAATPELNDDRAFPRPR